MGVALEKPCFFSRGFPDASFVLPSLDLLSASVVLPGSSASSSSLQRAASRLVLLMEQNAHPDGMAIGILLSLIDLTKCRGRKGPSNVTIQTGSSTTELKGVEAVHYALAAAVTSSYFAEKEDCGPTRMSPNCTTLKSLAQFRELLAEHVGNLLFAAAEDGKEPDPLRGARGLPRLPAEQERAEVEEMVTQIKLQIMHAVKLGKFPSARSLAPQALLFFLRPSKPLPVSMVLL